MVRPEDVKFDYSKPANKFLLKHEEIRERFKDSIMKILNKDNPEQVNDKKLKGRFAGYSRIAIGSYRIIYKVENGEIIVVNVAYAGSRGDIYKKFRG